MYWEYRKFRHLVCNYRNKKKVAKRKLVPQNKFEIIVSRVIQCGVKEEVKMRKQKTVKKEVQYFRYWRVGHYK